MKKEERNQIRQHLQAILTAAENIERLPSEENIEKCVTVLKRHANDCASFIRRHRILEQKP